MAEFMVFFIPLITPVVLFFAAFILLVCEVKMISEIVSDHSLSRLDKVLWTVAMIPGLPVTAAAYYLLKHAATHCPHTEFRVTH